jgi:hypothetical protein
MQLMLNSGPGSFNAAGSGPLSDLSAFVSRRYRQYSAKSPIANPLGSILFIHYDNPDTTLFEINSMILTMGERVNAFAGFLVYECRRFVPFGPIWSKP